MALLDYFTRRPDGRCEPVSSVQAAANPPRMKPGKAALTAIVGTAAAGLIAVVAQWEGKSNDPYRDLVGVWTVCYGETRVAMRRYSDAECEDMLAGGLADFAGPVLARNPTLKGHDPQTLAAVSLAYNIGGAAYNRSTVARRFSEGRWRSACDAFLLWTRAGGREVKGLRNRREAERRICLREIPVEFNR